MSCQQSRHVYKSLVPPCCVLSIAMFKLSLRTYSRLISALGISLHTKIKAYFCASLVCGDVHKCAHLSKSSFNNQVSHCPIHRGKKLLLVTDTIWAELDRLNFNQVDFGLCQCCDRGRDAELWLMDSVLDCLCCVCVCMCACMCVCEWVHVSYLSGSWHVSESSAF